MIMRRGGQRSASIFYIRDIVSEIASVSITQFDIF
jgi:hypothetical protein